MHLDTPSNSEIFVQLNPNVLSSYNISMGVSKDRVAYYYSSGCLLLFLFIVTQDAARVVGVTAMEEM